MNCEACPTPEYAEEARKSALCYLQNRGELPKDSKGMAIRCLECASKMLAEEATRKREGAE